MNPRQVRAFAKAVGRLAKTDKIDAALIAAFAQKMQPRVTQPINQQQEQLTAYQNRYRQLSDSITMEKNRLDKADSSIKKSIQRIIAFLQKELLSIEEKLKSIVEQDAVFQQKCRLLNSIKGVSLKTSTALLALARTWRLINA